MIRTQIQLSEDQARRVRDAARRQGVSMAEIIRACIDEALLQRAPTRVELYARAAGVVGSIEDPQGATDLSESHDHYLFKDPA